MYINISAFDGANAVLDKQIRAEYLLILKYYSHKISKMQQSLCPKTVHLEVILLVYNLKFLLNIIKLYFIRNRLWLIIQLYFLTNFASFWFLE